MRLSDYEFLSAGFRHILGTSDLYSTLTGLVRAAANAVGGESGSLYLLNKRTGVLEPYILVNFPDDYLAGCSAVPLGTQCCGRAALHKMPWIVEDMWTDPLFADCREAARRSGMRSGFSVPVLAANGDCLGALGCQFTDRYSPDSYAIERNKLFAQLIAFAIARDSTLKHKKAAASMSSDATEDIHDEPAAAD